MIHDALDVDLLVVGGGINGTGIARDAAGRGLSVAGREGRSGQPHLVCVYQADPWRLALSRIWRIPAGARGTDRARASLGDGPAHHLGAALRAAADQFPAARLDGAARPVPLRSSGRTQEASRDANRQAGPSPRGKRSQGRCEQGVRVFGLLGRRQPTGRAERPRCCRSRGGDHDTHEAGRSTARSRRMARDDRGRGDNVGRAAHRDRARDRQCRGPMGRSRPGLDPRRPSGPRHPARQGQPHRHPATVRRRSRVSAPEHRSPRRLRHTI